MMVARFRFVALAALIAVGASTANAQVTTFSTDVATAIDMGLAALTAAGAYSTGSSAGEAAGLAALALLEKRISPDYSAPAQGYSAASAADKTKIDDIITYIINAHGTAGFYAYRDGGDMMALAVYLKSGGPNSTLAGARSMLPSAALNAAFDRTAANQNGSGYWCYTNGGCNDSSTTQLVMAGLAAARTAYSATGPTPDPGRLATLNAAADLAETAYAGVGGTGQCSPLSGTEQGHGYNLGNCNSLQQTASGTWIQLVGGSTVNSTGVQNYLEWIRNRYDYPTNGNASDSWGISSYYYLWSSSKAYNFIKAGPAATGTNLDPDDLGVLPPGSAPAFAGRKLHRSPASDSRVPLFGAGGVGYYGAETARWYYDYAYELLLDQDGSGNFSSDGGSWEYYSNQSYAILVLESSVGGGCIDSNGNTVCDIDETPVCTVTSQTLTMVVNNSMSAPLSFSAGAVDPDAQPLNINVVSVMQDERTRVLASDPAPDATLASNNTGATDLRVRRQRGTPAKAGNGRFYHITFVATDPDGFSCQTTMTVVIPGTGAPVDGGSLFNSFQIN
jgi:hypothetical protein